MPASRITARRSRWRQTLSAIGFDLLQTANTCSIQNGLSGLQSTISYLTNAGIDHAGTYADADGASRPTAAW